VAGRRTGAAGAEEAETAKPSVRAKVLKAAMEVAAERGPDRLRVQDIAERAGMSPGHVMYYFGKRDRILVDTLLLAESDLAAQRDRRLASAASPVEALDRLVRLYLPAGAEDVRWKLWAQLVARPPRDAETLAAYTAVIDSWADALARVIREGEASGDFACDEVEEVAARSCRLMDGYALEVLLGAPGRTRAWAVAQVRAALDRELAVR
jgi:AcrR family transcriptional regulator